MILNFKYRMKKVFLTGFTTIMGILTILFATLLISRLRMPFNSMGNYFDQTDGVVYHEHSVMVYGLISAVLLFFTALSIFLLKRK